MGANLIPDILVEILTGEKGTYWYKYIKDFCDILLKYYIQLSLPMLKQLPLHTHTRMNSP